MCKINYFYAILGHFVETAFMTEKIIDLSITMKEGYVSSPIFAYMRKGLNLHIS